MGGEGNSETLMAEIRKVRLSELESFIQSESFGQLANIPITPARAKSYIKNPHGLPDDVVLIMAFTDGQLVAFRSLFAGTVQKGMREDQVWMVQRQLGSSAIQEEGAFEEAFNRSLCRLEWQTDVYKLCP
jgi:hypothetical protein